MREIPTNHKTITGQSGSGAVTPQRVSAHSTALASRNGGGEMRDPKYDVILDSYHAEDGSKWIQPGKVINQQGAITWDNIKELAWRKLQATANINQV